MFTDAPRGRRGRPRNNSPSEARSRPPVVVRANATSSPCALWLSASVSLTDYKCPAAQQLCASSGARHLSLRPITRRNSQSRWSEAASRSDNFWELQRRPRSWRRNGGSGDASPFTHHNHPPRPATNRLHSNQANGPVPCKYKGIREFPRRLAETGNCPDPPRGRRFKCAG